MGYHFSSRLTATLNLCLIYFKITWALSTLLEHMHKKFEINQTKIKGSCQLGRKVVTHNSKSDLPLVNIQIRIWNKLKYFYQYFHTACRKNLEEKKNHSGFLYRSVCNENGKKRGFDVFPEKIQATLELLTWQGGIIGLTFVVENHFPQGAPISDVIRKNV